MDNLNQNSLTDLIYTKLVSEINNANEAYYYSDTPIMSDALYDQMYLMLQQLEHDHPQWITPDSPTQRAGSPISKSKQFNKFKHTHPMLSLKTETDFTEKGAIDFDNRVKRILNVNDIVYCVEPKFDGLGIDLTYVYGKLLRALTRGDGVYGEDVTANVKMIEDIPKVLSGEEINIPSILIVRGEVLMFKDVFIELNKEKILNGEKEYSNTRNTAAGALRQLDPLKTKERKLNFFAYQAVEIQGLHKSIQTHSKQLTLLKCLGFPICDLNKLVVNTSELVTYLPHIKNIRADLPFDIDGVVYKVDDLLLQSKLGVTGREPNWAVAHKFPAEEKVTKLIFIDVQVGRTGKLTPVARLEPISVGGVVVTNVTLHNESEIKRKDIRVGDTVIVRRAGDVIPEIVGPFNIKPENERAALFKIPHTCPVCSSPVVKEEDEVDYRCTGGFFCSAQRKQAILHFSQRGAVEIKGLGESLVDLLVDKSIVTTVSDLYCIGLRKVAIEKGISLLECIKSTPKSDALAYKTLRELDRINDKSANNILKAIEESKKTTLQKFIYGLGIRHAGEGTAKRLVKHYHTLDNIKATTKSELLSIRDIGDIVADSVYMFFNNANNLKVIDELIALGITWNEESENTTKQSLYVGQNVVITGSLVSMSRQQLKDQLEALGANVQGSVGKSTNLVISGPGAGSKLTDAQRLGVKVIDEQTYLDSLKV